MAPTITSSPISDPPPTQDQKQTLALSQVLQTTSTISTLNTCSPSRLPVLASTPVASLQHNHTAGNQAVTTNARGTDNQHYDHDTVLKLLSMMRSAGYGDRKQQKKSLKDIFIKATDLGLREHGIKRSPKAWQKKFTRMKQEYSALIAKISESGRAGDDPELYDKPEFMNSCMNLNEAKHATIHLQFYASKNASIVSDLPLTSTRKRHSHAMLMETFFEERTKRHDSLLAEIKRGNEEKAKMRSVIERLVEKL